ncbi:MAG: DJ-1/PfpI family protein [Victivallaceae bacterium]|nr:DJ-1/PfpI family protein [Victivallaceae bacterium]
MYEKILVVLADGFEEIEALGAIDVLRRMKFVVTPASLDGKTQIVGCHGIAVAADTALKNCKSSDFNAIVLPGGMPGAENLRRNETLRFLLQSFAAEGKIIAAICAAPMVLAQAGVLAGKRFTMYPGFEAFLGGLVPSEKSAEIDGNIVTGRGPGALFDFCAGIASALGVPEVVSPVYQAMFVEK